MKRLALALALASLPACVDTPPQSASSVQPIADGVVIRGTQALIIANLTYQSLATPVAVAMETGVITGALKTQIQALDRQVIAALRAGREAQSVAEKGRQGAAALAVLADIARLSGIPLPRF